MEDQNNYSKDSQNDEDVFTEHEKLEILRLWRKHCQEVKADRVNDWNEIYQLYRDKVVYNRLTQRQTVNVPLMKSSILTLLKDMDDAPLLHFDNKDNDDQKELFYNEYWKVVSRENKLVLQDIIDKKQALLYGRSFKKLNIINGMVTWEVVDPGDILVDKYVDSSNLDTARILIHQHIYMPLKDIENNEAYDQEEVEKLVSHMHTVGGQLEASQNAEDMENKYDRDRVVGIDTPENPTLGETYVELEEFYAVEYDEDKKTNIFKVYVVAQDKAVLMETKLCDLLGETSDDYWYNHLPYSTWSADIDKSAFWNDGVGDVLRGPNKTFNTWYAQIAENRTLKNFHMQFYDATLSEQFVPQTFQPKPFGFYPSPGNPNNIFKEVPVGDLGDNIKEMEYFINIAKEAVSANNTNQGVVEKSKVTLGEVELALANSKERIKAYSVFYNESWIDFGFKYAKLLEGRSDLIADVEITKKGKYGKKNWTRTIKSKDWISANGYQPNVMMIQDKAQENADSINKLSGIKQFFVENPPLDKIIQRRALEFAGTSLEERKEVLDYEDQKGVQVVQPGLGGMMAGAPGGANAPPPPRPIQA